MAKAVWEGILLRSTCLSLAREDQPFQRRFRCSQPVNRGSEIWQGVNKGGIDPGSPPQRLRTSSTCDLCFQPPHLAGRKGFDPGASAFRVRYTIALH